MSVKFMNGIESSKYSIPENEISSVRNITTEIKNDINGITDDIKQLKVSIDCERSKRYQNNEEVQMRINSMHSDIYDIRNRSEPIFNVLAIIVTTKWFMFINRFAHMVAYDIADSHYENIIYVYPVPIDATITFVKEMNKRFRKRIKNNHIDISKCTVKFAYREFI